ncbi:tRNA wybutosine-synthesizing protein 5-like [Mercenaria mercenaria]|uniref:tRNA wybutosine-synthesizing protein 5-like n=1 Tax=Mercenaria mercenaria TaxID=6596 RepID=UPI00234F8400|nr:tRNA wybutosine-synthesizing protein 5-like [Mercenaria mercenaria]
MSSPKSVNIHHGIDSKSFDQLYSKREPVVLRGLDIGSCREKWTPEYLAEKGGTREVKIHVSKTAQMDFINKNFMYRSLPFSELVKRASKAKQEELFIEETEKYYLRALGDDPRKDIADIRVQFPALAEDILFPEFYPKEKFFSSVFRIASPGLQLWTHYDVMDNFLIQVQGRKRVVLFSPRSVNYLYMNGDKSEVLDIDNVDKKRYPLFSKAERFEVFLEHGDVLFIPALWFHNVISLEFGVAVNVFWKHLENAVYDNKDTYGNKDPLPASRAFQIIDRAVKTLDELPEPYREFYARRLIDRIEKKAVKNFPT